MVKLIQCSKEKKRLCYRITYAVIISIEYNTNFLFYFFFLYCNALRLAVMIESTVKKVKLNIEGDSKIFIKCNIYRKNYNSQYEMYLNIIRQKVYKFLTKKKNTTEKFIYKKHFWWIMSKFYVPQSNITESVKLEDRNFTFVIFNGIS